MLRASALAFGLALVAVGGSSAEVVSRSVQDGLLGLGAGGKPYVVYVRGTRVVLAKRVAKGDWQATTIGSAAAGSQVKAFAVGSRGPVALVGTADGRRIFLVRRVPVGWQTTRIAGSLPGGVRLGWPGLALDQKGLPVVAYTRWNSANFQSRLLLVRVGENGQLTSKRITYEGFPESYVPPPAKPVVLGSRVDVIESYGFHGVVGTIEWYPNKRTWTGLFIDAGVGDFPLGPVLALRSRTGRVYAAWTESMLGLGDAPVTLAERGRQATSDFVLDRALAIALALPASGPEVAANEWVDATELGLGGDEQLWAGKVVHDRRQIELDGWIAGLAAAPRGGRDVLLGGSAGLRWFRSARQLGIRVSLDAETDEGSGSVRLSGTVWGVSSGRVTIYRERPGSARQAVGRAALAGGAFSLVDSPSLRPLLYRAVYTDPATGIPYAALLRVPVS
jgi:hypothetical protein